VTRGALAAVAAALLAACAGGPPPPAPLDTRNDACAYCRMAVSERRFAAQVVAPAEEPLFFDDLGCLRSWLGDENENGDRLSFSGESGTLPISPTTEKDNLSPFSIAYVADHRTGEWVPASVAVYTEVPGLETPMGSHLIAHADAASRAADPIASSGKAARAAEVFGATLPEGKP